MPKKNLKPRRFSLGPIDLVEDISLLYHCFTLSLEQGLLVVVMITDKGRHFHTSMRVSSERTDKLFFIIYVTASIQSFIRNYAK